MITKIRSLKSSNAPIYNDHGHQINISRQHIQTTKYCREIFTQSSCYLHVVHQFSCMLLILLPPHLTVESPHKVSVLTAFILSHKSQDQTKNKTIEILCNHRLEKHNLRHEMKRLTSYKNVIKNKRS